MRIALTGICAWLVGAITLLGAVVHADPPGSLDDAFVTLVEARTWLGQGGAPWGPPEVESATSPLDVMAKAVGLSVAPSADPLRWAGWFGLAVMLASLGLVAAFAATATRSIPGAAAITVGWALSLGLVESAGYRLEGPLFAGSWFALLYSAVHRRWRLAALLSVFVALARPEGLILTPFVVAWAARSCEGSVPEGTAEGVPGRRGWPPLRGLVAGLLVVGAITLCRYLIFDELLPNTYYAKSSDHRLHEIRDGLDYLAGALAGPSGAALLLLAAALLLALVGDERRTAAGGKAQGLLAISLLTVIVLVASGGDAYPGARLALPIAAPLWMAAACLWHVGPARLVATAALAGALLQAWAAAPAPWPGSSVVVDGTVQALRGGPFGAEAFGGEPRFFRSVAEALGDEVLAHRHCQRFRWFEPETKVLDLTGLTDGDIARLPAPRPVRFGRDALSLALARRVGAFHLDPASARAESLADHDLFAALTDPALSVRFIGPYTVETSLAEAIVRDYVAASSTNLETGGVFNLIVRRDLAERFRGVGFRVD